MRFVVVVVVVVVVVFFAKKKNRKKRNRKPLTDTKAQQQRLPFTSSPRLSPLASRLSSQDRFYLECGAAGRVTQLAYIGTESIGAIACRLELLPDRSGARMYIMTVGVLAGDRSTTDQPQHNTTRRNATQIKSPPSLRLFLSPKHVRKKTKNNIMMMHYVRTPSHQTETTSKPSKTNIRRQNQSSPPFILYRLQVAIYNTNIDVALSSSLICCFVLVVCVFLHRTPRRRTETAGWARDCYNTL